MVVYQVAEALGMTSESVRDNMTPTELAEWSYYLNSPFSRKGRETLMNGWLVHTIRSIVADKRHKPEFHKAIFPFDKVYKQFFEDGKQGTGKSAAKSRSVKLGEVAHGSHLVHLAFEKKLADYKAGRVTNRFGLYIGEKMRG